MATITIQYQNHSVPNNYYNYYYIILIYEKVFFYIGILKTKIMHTVLNTMDLICIYDVA